MIHLLILVVHLLATIAKLMRPGGARAVVAESLLLKHLSLSQTSSGWQLIENRAILLRYEGLLQARAVSD